MTAFDRMLLDMSDSPPSATPAATQEGSLAKARFAGHFMHAAAQFGSSTELAERAASDSGILLLVAGYICGLISAERYIRSWHERRRPERLAGGADNLYLLTKDEIQFIHDQVRQLVCVERADPSGGGGGS